MSSVHEIVTERIIAQLETGTVPWRRPWTGFPAMNWVSQKPYRGLNALLPPGEYATFNQVSAAGGTVNRGAKGNLVIYWKPPTRSKAADDDEDEERRPPVLRYYYVFEITAQCTGLKPKREQFEHDPIAEAQALIDGYKDGPEIRHAPGRACYSPMFDQVSIPERGDFEVGEMYYSTLYHELTHSTGHEKRLAREGVTQLTGFGSEQYSKEELVAELGAAMLCAVAGIDNSRTEPVNAAYIAGWLGALRDDKKLVVQAASQAQRAVDYIRGIAPEGGSEE